MRAVVASGRYGVLAAFLVFGFGVRAQQPAGMQKENGVYTLHEGTHLVLLDVTVADKQGHPVTGLTNDDFKLTEDGQPQTIKFFEEHAPVDPAEIARQKAAALAGQPNTFSNYEPIGGRPITILLLNELFFLPWRDFNPLSPGRSPLRKRMIEAVQTAPPNTPFALYMLDSELQLVQPVTTDRARVLAKIDALWANTHFGSERMINPNGKLDSRGVPPAEDIPVRRRITSDAMRQLAWSLNAQPGRKNLLFFTGAFHCSVVAPYWAGAEFLSDCPHLSFPNDSVDYLCGLMDTLEQGRMSIYRDYPGTTGYGFGCPSASNDLGTSANYYTLYYTPTNGDWNGKYRTTTVEVADKGLRLAYRKGYFGAPENAEVHYYTAPARADSGGAGPSGPIITATPVAAGHADAANLGASAAEAAPNPANLALHRRQEEVAAAKPAPNPASSVFTVRVIPASTTNPVGKDKQEYRRLTLQFTMPASEFKVVQSDSGQYVARLEISADGYADGISQETYASQVVANFDGAADPRIANSTITAKLTVNMLEHGHSRWLDVTVRDAVTGQFGSLVIPMGQVKIPVAQ